MWGINKWATRFYWTVCGYAWTCRQDWLTEHVGRARGFIAYSLLSLIESSRDLFNHQKWFEWAFLLINKVANGLESPFILIHIVLCEIIIHYRFFYFSLYLSSEERKRLGYISYWIHCISYLIFLAHLMSLKFPMYINANVNIKYNEYPVLSLIKLCAYLIYFSTSSLVSLSLRKKGTNDLGK